MLRYNLEVHCSSGRSEGDKLRLLWRGQIQIFCRCSLICAADSRLSFTSRSLKKYQCSTEGQKRHQNSAPVLVIISGNSLVFSEPIFGKGMRRSTFQWKKGVFSEKGGGNSVNQGFGKDFYRKGNSAIHWTAGLWKLKSCCPHPLQRNQLLIFFKKLLPVLVLPVLRPDASATT